MGINNDEYEYLTTKCSSGYCTDSETDRLSFMEFERAYSYLKNSQASGNEDADIGTFLLENNTPSLQDRFLENKEKGDNAFNSFSKSFGKIDNSPFVSDENRAIVDQLNAQTTDVDPVFPEMSDEMRSRLRKEQEAKYATPKFEVSTRKYTEEPTMEPEVLNFDPSIVVNSGDVRPTVDSSNIDLSGIGDNVTLDDFNWNPTKDEVDRAGLSKFKSVSPQLSNAGDSAVTRFPVRDKDNKISGYEKKPSWIEGKLSMVPDHTNKTHPKDPMKGMGLKYGVDFNTQFDTPGIMEDLMKLYRNN